MFHRGKLGQVVLAFKDNLDVAKRTPCPYQRHMSKRRNKSDEEQPKYPEIGERVRALRVLTGMSANKFANEIMKIDQSSWSRYELGKRKPTVDHAMEVVRRAGVTLEWIYSGDEQNCEQATLRLVHAYRHEGSNEQLGRMARNMGRELASYRSAIAWAPPEEADVA